MFFNQQKTVRYSMLALCFAISFDTLAASDRMRLSDDEILAMGEDPKSGEFFRLIPSQHATDADQLAPNGGSATFYTPIAASEFRPRSSRGFFNVPNHASLTCQVTSNNSLAEAQLQLPQGATLQFLRIYGNDSSDQDLNVALVERCQPFTSAGNVTTTVLTSVLSSGTPGRFTLANAFPAGTTIDNELCIYSLRVQLASTANGCAAGLLLDKARVQWIE